MLDAFESRLRDLLADALATAEAAVTRPLDAPGPGADAGAVRVIAGVLGATADSQLGDDARERLGERGAYRLRPVLHLEGEVAVELIAPVPEDDSSQRQALMRTLDRVLLALDGRRVRDGRAFRTDQDQGFQLAGFRLVRVEPSPESPASADRLRAVFAFAGRFWPVEEPAEGGLITALPARLAVLPVRLPEGLAATAGGGDLEIPIALDLRVLNGAPARLGARILGASPIGGLIAGDGPAAPAVELPPADGGEFRFLYRPPAQLGAPARVRVTIALESESTPAVDLGLLTIEVTP